MSAWGLDRLLGNLDPIPGAKTVIDVKAFGLTTR